ncbi:hypothetical protein [Microbulbifer hainanensis]|uniref:hypothetical protein n=1 Tax=Microbulbifer hainanensis TaxID=2735675 RepID=UPI001865DF0D|nr:hypothetical protein [Microbulbifer hainanensis]
MFLPVKVSFDLPLLPELNQETIPALSALFGCVVIKKIPFNFLPESNIEKFIVIILLLTPIVTVLTNLDPVLVGSDLRPALQYKQIITMPLIVYLKIIPFLLGLSLIRSKIDLLKLLQLMVFAGIIYSPLVLLEVRLSPQLHTFVYGFFPHEFSQQIRLDGFRPVVFMGHGLLVSIFYVAVFLCAVELSKHRRKLLGIPAWLIIIYLSLVLMFCKSVGAWGLSLFGFSIINLFGYRGLSRISLILALLVIFYPLLSMANLFPHKEFVDLAGMFGGDRAQSLDFRFFNENRLIEHTRDKLLFGWGGWDRNRPEGIVTDGFWVIQYSTFGIVGFVAIFGLILSPVFKGRKSIQMISEKELRRYTAFAMFFTALMTINQIPNSSMYSWLWFFLGGMAGFSSKFKRTACRRRHSPVARNLQNKTASLEEAKVQA